MRKITRLLFLSFLIGISACTNQANEQKAKYVFLFIGDGMGVNQVYSAQLYKAAQAKQYEPVELNLTQLPVQSYMTTFSANHLVTCSSASGTALASGHKTNNGVLGKDTSLTINYETVAEKAQKLGFKVGILSSVGINHATPASFYAHQNSRGMYYEIAGELPQSNFDYFGGGGFIKPKGKTNDKPDAYQIAVDNGYNYVHTTIGIEALKNGAQKVLAVNPELYDGGEFYWEIDKKEGSVSLAEFTRKGIEVLDNPKGFFMMVEGGKIDWACHSNDAATSIHETLAFDDAVAEALEFYKLHPDETLIIVTADHETGGMILGNGGYDVHMELLANQTISAQEFGREVVDFQQKNPKASFDEVMTLVQKYFGLGNESKGLALSDEELAQFKNVYTQTFKGNKGLNPDKNYLDANDLPTLPDLAISVLNKKAGVGWASTDHSGTPVPVRVIGQGQRNFTQSIDNTDVPKIVAKLMGFEL
jgi:alkaline phosphatase